MSFGFRSKSYKSEIDALRIGLGAQLSQQHPDFRTLPLMTPELAQAWLFLDKLPKLLGKNNPIDFIKDLIKIIGETDNLYSYNELSRLSMIVGDTRKVFKVFSGDTNPSSTT